MVPEAFEAGLETIVYVKVVELTKVAVNVLGDAPLIVIVNVAPLDNSSGIEPLSKPAVAVVPEWLARRLAEEQRSKKHRK